MTIYETKTLYNCCFSAIEEEGRKGWQPVDIAKELGEHGDWNYDITFQRPSARYTPPIEVGEAISQIMNAKTALKAELGITRQGSCGSAMRKALAILQSLYENNAEDERA